MIRLLRCGAWILWRLLSNLQTISSRKSCQQCTKATNKQAIILTMHTSPVLKEHLEFVQNSVVTIFELLVESRTGRPSGQILSFWLSNSSDESAQFAIPFPTNCRRIHSGLPHLHWNSSLEHAEIWLILNHLISLSMDEFYCGFNSSFLVRSLTSFCGQEIQRHLQGRRAYRVTLFFVRLKASRISEWNKSSDVTAKTRMFSINEPESLPAPVASIVKNFDFKTPSWIVWLTPSRTEHDQSSHS